MKKIILCVAFSLMAVIPCIANDPNNPLIVDCNSYEARIKELEDKIIVLENRISGLESQRTALPTRSPNLTSSTKNDPNKDALRIERSAKAVQDILALIALYETQLNNLPSCYHLPLPDKTQLENLPHYYYYYYYYSVISYHFESLEDELNWALDNIELLDNIDREYKKINNYVHTSPELKNNRYDCSTRLIELKSESGGFDKLRDDLRKRIERIGRTFMRSRCYESVSKRSIKTMDMNNAD